MHLQADGVTDNVHVKSFSFTLIVDKKPYFYKKIEADGSSENTEYVAGKIRDVINELQHPDRGAIVVSCTLDNVAVNAAAQRVLQAEFRQVIFLGCSAHGINLLTKDLLRFESTPAVKDGRCTVTPAVTPSDAVIVPLKEIIIKVRNTGIAPKYEAVRKSSPPVQLPHDYKPHPPRRMCLNGETRWVSHWRMFRFASENREALQRFTADVSTLTAEGNPANAAALGDLAVSV